jgi:rhamnulokinase/L-fuculokinase
MEETGMGPVPVIAVGCHDTASAVCGAPIESENSVFLSSGTWSLIGMEIDEPIINEKSLGYNFTNEGGVENTIRFLKNITGLWIMQELKRHFEDEGKNYGFGEMAELAKKTGKIKCFIDPDSPLFASKGNIVAKMNTYLKDSGQEELTDDGEILKCAYDSLVLTFRLAYEQMCQSVGKDFDTVYIMGGGIRDTYLCQLAANAMNKKIVTGPVDGTALGNVALQLCKDNLSEIKDIIVNSVETKTYIPEDTEIWDKAYEDYEKTVK